MGSVRIDTPMKRSSARWGRANHGFPGVSPTAPCGNDGNTRHGIVPYARAQFEKDASIRDVYDPGISGPEPDARVRAVAERLRRATTAAAELRLNDSRHDATRAARDLEVAPNVERAVGQGIAAERLGAKPLTSR
jgi:hypothetical protein